MSGELRTIMSGVAPGAAEGAEARPERRTDRETDPALLDDPPSDADLDVAFDASTGRSGDDSLIDPLSDSTLPPTRRTRAEREADAEERLAALKRRMGK